MTTSFLEYELVDGFIHNWLVLGPVETAVQGAEGVDEHTRKMEIARELYSPELVAMEAPVDRGVQTIGDVEYKWQYIRTLEDHFVDVSLFRHTWTYLQTWAYTQLSVIDAAEATFALTTNGPADVWINGTHVHRQEHFSHQDPQRVTFTANLGEGTNEIMVRMEEVAARECPYLMALHVAGVDAEDTQIIVPTNCSRPVIQRMLEEGFPYAYLENEVSFKGRKVNLRFAEDMEINYHYHYSIQDSRNRIQISGQQVTEPGAVVEIGHPMRIFGGPYRAVLRSRQENYFGSDLRYQWDLPFTILDTEYAKEPYGTFPQRVAEALNYAVTQENDLYGQIAMMHLGQWDKLDLAVFDKAIARINARGDCSDFDLVGLLGTLYRYGDNPAYPESLKTAIKDCALNFKYWHDEPGADAMCYTTENHSILFHTSEVLAGQLWPEETFSNVGEKGSWHLEKGSKLATEWLEKRGATGFWEWDSNCYFDEDLLALSHLSGLSKDEDLAELAAILMDKMLFTMAVNSYKGAFGSTHGRTYSRMLKSAQLEPTSGIFRMMFGVGVFNANLRGMVGIAISEYEFPLMLADIANDTQNEIWDRERHVIDDTGNEINKVTFRTPDYMLASVQDYRPGEKGYQQHIWQATFGPDTNVFVTHPPRAGEDGAHRPNFWHGNYILPRVAQHKDVLFALHKLPDDDWMGFTHAHFPVHEFDEFGIRAGWAFAREGDGYIALTASTGLEFMNHGTAAYRELRAQGPETAWICQMGRVELDGDFAAFQEKVLAQTLQVDGLQVSYTSTRGESLEFSWDGAFKVNGEEQPLDNFKHYESPYCVAELPAKEMDIQFGETVMRLSFQA